MATIANTEPEVELAVKKAETNAAKFVVGLPKNAKVVVFSESGPAFFNIENGVVGGPPLPNGKGTHKGYLEYKVMLAHAEDAVVTVKTRSLRYYRFDMNGGPYKMNDKDGAAALARLVKSDSGKSLADLLQLESEESDKTVAVLHYYLLA